QQRLDAVLDRLGLDLAQPADLLGGKGAFRGARLFQRRQQLRHILLARNGRGVIFLLLLCASLGHLEQGDEPESDGSPKNECTHAAATSRLFAAIARNGCRRGAKILANSATPTTVSDPRAG